MASYIPTGTTYGETSGFGTTTPANYGLGYNLQQNNTINSGGAAGTAAGGYNPYVSTYNPNTPGASASSLQSPTTQAILDQLAGKSTTGETNQLWQAGLERGVGFGVDNPATASQYLIDRFGLAGKRVQEGITNSFSQQGIDNQSSQYNTTLQNNKDQFAAQLGLDYSKLNEQQRQFVDSQAQQATQFQQKMQLEWAALNQHGAGLGGSSGGGGRNSGGGDPGGGGSSGGGTLQPPYPTTTPGQTDPTTDWWSNPDNFDASGNPIIGNDWGTPGSSGYSDYPSDSYYDPGTNKSYRDPFMDYGDPYMNYEG